METILKNDLILSIQDLKNENETLKKLSTKEGFFRFYFSILKDCKSKIDAFQKVNNLYFNHFGEYRYKNFKEFRNSV